LFGKRNLGLTQDGLRGRISKSALTKSKPAATISKSGATISKSIATKSKFDTHIFQWLGLNSGTSPQSRSRESQPPLCLAQGSSFGGADRGGRFRIAVSFPFPRGPRRWF
jgi:hypothetical protein